MRVQDILGHWYEVEDALLANCAVEMEPESQKAGSVGPAIVAVKEPTGNSDAAGSGSNIEYRGSDYFAW